MYSRATKLCCVLIYGEDWYTSIHIPESVKQRYDEQAIDSTVGLKIPT